LGRKDSNLADFPCRSATILALPIINIEEAGICGGGAIEL
jgi:hypothetical protein